MILYRPVGLQELELIYDGSMKAFPARLPQQPIFYPVLDIEYARKTASDWNAKSGQFAGYVTQFNLEDQYINQFEKHTVGGSHYHEFWIPADELEEFNRHITGHIKVVEAYFGDSFQGFVPDKFGLQGKNAVAQFTELANFFLYKRMDFYLEIKRNHKAIFLNYPFWQKHDSKNQGLQEKVLQAVREAWLTSFPKTPLVSAPPKDIGSPMESASDSLDDPVQEDPPPAKQTISRASVKPVHEDTPPVKKKNSHPIANREQEDTPPTQQTDSRTSVKPVHEDAPPVRKIDSHPIAKPEQDDAPSVKPANSRAFVRPLSRENPPANKAESHPFVKPVPGGTAPKKQTPSHFEQGLELGLSGRYREAIDELSRAVQQNPGHVLARISLGVAFHRLGEDDRALSCYEAALRLDPKQAEAHYFQANILYDRGDVREAIAEYTTAVGLDPELIKAHEETAPTDRLTDYTGSPAGMYQIARYARRILELNQSLENNPRQTDLFKERASAYSRLGNYEQAIKDYDACLAIQPDDAGALHFRGLAYDQIGQPERALKDYQQAAAANPQLSDVYINRGIELGRTGQFRQSIDNLSEGIRLAPTNPNGYFNRGATYLQLGDFENAIADFSKVIQLSSNDEDAFFWRGIAHEEAGHRREAIADYRQFLTISQNPRAKQEIDRKLSQWNEGRESGVSGRNADPEEGEKTNKVQPGIAEQGPDLYDLIAALGERALASIWLGSGVDCYGEAAKELFMFTNQNQPMEGEDFLRIASGIRQTKQGDFQAFDPGADTPWIFIRAWEGSGFYVETDDPKIKKRLKSRFRSIEEVEGATPDYEGLFIRI